MRSGFLFLFVLKIKTLNPQNPNQYNWLFIDLNSYFASVEQQMNPAFRNRPLAVVPVMTDSTSCIAASYEAKARGVRTGTRVGDAKKMCPGLILVEARHEHYVDYHQRLIDAIERCHPITSVHSIDEVALRLSGRDKNEANAIELANQVKQSIYKVGEVLHCSIGIAPNRFLAKLGSDMKKPNGLTLLRKEDLPDKLLPLKLRDIPGIGARMEERLNKNGITRMDQLLKLDMHGMRDAWGGIWGERLFKWMRGEDFDVEYSEHKSIGHQHVLPPELRSQKGGYAVAQKLLYKAGARLRKHHLWASRMQISVRFSPYEKFSDEIKMLECQDPLTLLEAFQVLWKRVPLKAPMKVGITLVDLIHEKERTFSLFENPKRHKLSLAMDSLNQKYGKNTIYLGGTHNVQASAPTRIAFSNIPDFTI